MVEKKVGRMAVRMVVMRAARKDVRMADHLVET